MQNVFYLCSLFVFSIPAFAINNVAAPAVGSGIPSPSANMLEVFLSLGIVIIVIFAFAWFMKRMGHINMTNNQVMHVKASLPLSAKEKLMVVQIGDEQVVIGVAPGFVGHIKTLDTPLVDAQVSPTMSMAKDSFANTLNALLKGKKQKENSDA